MSRVHAYPKEGFYGDCLYRPLIEAGVEIVEGAYPEIDGIARGDVVHLHWPSFLYAAGASRWEMARSLARFLLWLRALRARGARLFWTAHNLYPHERTRLPGADVLARRLIINQAEGIFVHGPTAQAVLLQEFPQARGKTVLIKHGVMAGYYPAHLERAQARARLGLRDSDFAYLFIGQWRPYKNLPSLIDAVADLADDSLLILAGNAPLRLRDAVVAQATCQLGARARIHAGRIADEDLQLFCRAADVAVLPYREILTSGAAVLALSFGCPVVAPRRGHLEDLIDESNGLLYPIDQADALSHALRAVRSRRFDRAAIEARMGESRWEEVAALTRGAYRL